MPLLKSPQPKLYGLLKALLLLTVLLVSAWYAYKPGLTGGYIFDDYHSLKKLAIIDGEVNLQNSLDYFKSSDTGPLKRPISVFSFLLDAQDWPADAYSFKRTNVLIHLINGALLFMLIWQVLSHHTQHRNVRYAVAFFATGFWLLHPFLASTTLYIVQRMAMLPLTFMLLGMLMYVWGRCRQQRSQSGLNYLILMTAVFGGTLLAMLSKENGVLFLPLMALFELFIVQKYLQLPPLSRTVRSLLFYLPIAVIVVGILLALPGFMQRYDVRDFTAYERQLSQFRVLTDYLYQLLIPKYFTYGVFTDGFKWSQGWLQPVTTLFSLVFIMVLLGGAWVLRNRYIWFSFSVFFFFIAHSIESTIIPLEMYFEHRNYVAAVFLGVPLSFAAIKIVSKTKLYYVIPMAVLVFLGFITFVRSNVWSDNFKLHSMTMAKFPESVRAATMTADFYARQGSPEWTLMILNQTIERHENLSLQLNRLQYLCNREGVTALHYENYFKQLFEDFRVVRFTQEDMVPYTTLFKKLLRSECGTSNDNGYAIKLYESLLVNPANDRQYMQALVDVYGMHYYIETKQFEKVSDSLTLVITKYHGYKDAFQGLNALIEEEQYLKAQTILNILEKDYQQQYSLKPDLENIGEQIRAFKDLLKERI